MEKLKEEHIKVGTIIWYSGSTSMLTWSCPAEITRVDQDKRIFGVMSLDDSFEHSQDYTFDISEHSPQSRLNMCIPTKEDVLKFLSTKENTIRQNIAHLNEEIRKEEVKLVKINSKFGHLLHCQD